MKIKQAGISLVLFALVCLPATLPNAARSSPEPSDPRTVIDSRGWTSPPPTTPLDSQKYTDENGVEHLYLPFNPGTLGMGASP